jgi:thermitase
MVERGVRVSRWLVSVLVLALAVGSVGRDAAGAQAPADFVPGEILVKFRPGTPVQAIAEAHQQNGGQVVRVIPGIDVQVVRVPVGQEADHVSAYTRNPNVLFAELNGFAIAVQDEPMVGPAAVEEPQ